MNKTALLWSCALAIALTFLGAGRPALAAPEIRTELSPRVVPIGRDAEFTIIVQGVTRSPTPTLPRIPGLETRSLGQTMSMEVRGGASLSEVRHRFLLRASRPGRYSIPPIGLRVEGRNLRTKAEILEVVGTGTRRRPSIEPPALELELHGLPGRPLWVGEIVPAEVRLYVRRGVQVSEATPTRAVLGNFTLLHPRERQPEQRAVRRHGQTYTELVFPVAIAPAEAGQQTFQVGMDVTATIPQPRQQRQGRSSFNDPFFDSFFSRRQAEKIPTQSNPLELQVQNLPSVGRPANFGGGIGRFTLQTRLQPTTIDPGDPVSLEVQVSGRGNFDRLALAGVPETSDWKAYPGRADFRATDELGIAGVKTFEQALIPLGEGSQQLPAITLSFFDPEAGTWESLSALPPAVLIRAVNTIAPPPGAPRPARRAQLFELAPNRPDLGSLVSTLLPFSEPRLLISLQAVPVLLLLMVLFAIRRRRQRLGDPARQRMRQAASRLEQARAAATQATDLPQLLRVGREGIEEYLAIRADRTERHPSIAMSLRDLPDETLRDELRALFDESDRTAFAADGAPVPDLAAWRSRVQTILERLPKALGLVFLLACSSTPFALADPIAAELAGKFQAANEAFAVGRFGEAADRLAAVARQGGVSANLLFDLGNAALRAGRPGEAILAYERARLLAPRDSAIQANLRQARQVAELPAPEEDAWTRLADQLSPDDWALAATAVLFLTCLLVLLATLGRKTERIRSLLAIAAVALLLLWGLFATRLESSRFAIVTGNAPALLGAPFPSAVPDSNLKTGETVRVLSKHNGFLLVRTTDGRSGWTHPHTAEPITPTRLIVGPRADRAVGRRLVSSVREEVD
ncbi:MAG: BatD family protein [Deltaproteobacteria bacterium]